MDKIYEQAKDLHVVATYVYGNGTDTYAYVDADCTTKFKTSELKEVFVKGALINIDGAIFKPTGFGLDTSDLGVISYLTDDDTDGATVATLSAEADETDAE